MNLIYIYRAFHTNTWEHTCFSSAHGTYSRIGYILGHKTSPYKFKKTEIISCVFSDHNEVKADVNNKRNFRNYINAWRWNNILLSKYWVLMISEGKFKTCVMQQKQYYKGSLKQWVPISKNRKISSNLRMHIRDLEKEEKTKT
jgi:hypothetical protein